MFANWKFYVFFVLCASFSVLGHSLELYLVEKFWVTKEISIEQFLIGYFLRSVWSILIGYVFYRFIFNYCNVIIGAQMDNFKKYSASAPDDFVKNYTKNLDNYVHMVVVGSYQLIIDGALLAMYLYYFFMIPEIIKNIDFLMIVFGFTTFIVISIPIVLNFFITRLVNQRQIAFYQFIENFRKQIDTLNIFVAEREYIIRHGLRISKKYYELLKYQFFLLENVRYFNEAILVLALVVYIQFTGFSGELGIVLAGFFRFYPILMRCYSNANRIITGIPYARDFRAFHTKG